MTTHQPDTVQSATAFAVPLLEKALASDQPCTSDTSKEYRASARLEAEALLGHTLDRSRARLRTWPEHPLSESQSETFIHYVERRCAGEPVAYILGQREFYGLDLTVTPDTLIPRPETEQLVELALEKIPVDACWQLADLGTGSGAIALALAQQRPHCEVTAIDNSDVALVVARGNADRLHINNIDFQQGNWLDPLTSQRFHLIASNPPYVASEDNHLKQGDLRFEPPAALASGPDGLDDIRHIISRSPAHLNTDGWLLVEHGYDQAAPVLQLFKQHGFSHTGSLVDFGGNDRVTFGQAAE